MTQAALRPHDQLTHDEFTAISKAVHEFETLWRQTLLTTVENGGAGRLKLVALGY